MPDARAGWARADPAVRARSTRRPVRRGAPRGGGGAAGPAARSRRSRWAAPGAACWPSRSSPASPCRPSTTPRWTATPCVRRTSPGRRTTARSTLPVAADIPAGRTDVPAAGARHRAPDHDRRPAARRRRRDRAGRAHRRRRRPGAGVPCARGGHLGPPGRRGRRGRRRSCCRGHGAGRGADRRGRGRRRGDRAGAPPPDRAGAVHRLRAGRARAPRCSRGRSTSRTAPCSPPRWRTPGASPSCCGSCPTTSRTCTACSTSAWRPGTVDLVLTSGGVSAGAYEVVKERLAGRGVEFVKVAMQPGGPQGAGRVDGVGGRRAARATRSARRCRSRCSCARCCGPPSGTRTPTGRVVTAALADALTSTAGRRQFRRGVLDAVAGTVREVGGPPSHLLAALARADCFFVVPEEVTELDGRSAGRGVAARRADVTQAHIASSATISARRAS